MPIKILTFVLVNAYPAFTIFFELEQRLCDHCFELLIENMKLNSFQRFSKLNFVTQGTTPPSSTAHAATTSHVITISVFDTVVYNQHRIIHRCILVIKFKWRE